MRCRGLLSKTRKKKGWGCGETRGDLARYGLTGFFLGKSILYFYIVQELIKPRTLRYLAFILMCVCSVNQHLQTHDLFFNNFPYCRQRHRHLGCCRLSSFETGTGTGTTAPLSCSDSNQHRNWYRHFLKNAAIGNDA